MIELTDEQLSTIYGSSGGFNFPAVNVNAPVNAPVNTGVQTQLNTGINVGVITAVPIGGGTISASIKQLNYASQYEYQYLP